MRTLLAALLFTAVAAAQSFDELLPDSTFLYVSVENIARTKERWDKSPLAALWNDEAMQAFLEKPRAKWASWMEEIRKDDEFTPDDVLSVLAGQAVVALVWPEGAKEPTPVILADIGENGEKVRELVTKMEKQGAEEGERRDEEEFRGVKIVRYSKGDAAERTDEGAWFLDGKTFAAAEKADTLKDMLARKENKEGTLATREIYQRTRGRLGARAGEFFAYVDAPNLFKALQDSGELRENDIRIVQALGMMAIESLAVEIAIEPRGLALRMFLAVKGPKEGILKLFDAKNSALMPPRYAPTDALTAGAWTLDLPALYEEARKVADKIQQGSSAQMDGLFEMVKQQTGVDVPADIIGSLGTEIAYHTRTPEEGAPASPLGARVAMSIQLKDRERFEAAFEKLLGAAMPGLAAQDYLGVKLHVVPTPIGISPAFAVLPDRLLFGLSADDVKDVIARYGKEAKGMLDREDVAKALASLPAQRFIVSVEDLPKSLSSASSSLAGAMSLLPNSGDAGEFAEAVDFSLFPSAEVLKKYIGMAVAAMVNEEDGVSYLALFHLVGG
jgi:hypothetical protein